MRKTLLAFAFIGLAFIVGAIYAAIKQKAFIEGSVVTQGIIVELEARDSKGSNGRRTRYYYPIFTFTDNNNEVIKITSSTGSNPAAYTLNERVEVIYPPNDSHNAQINGFASLWLLPLIFGIFGLVFASIGAIPLIVMEKNKKLAIRLKQSGKAVVATINDIYINTSLKVQGRSPYVISCQWVDPMFRDKIYIFKSESIWFDPREYVSGKTMTVYIDETDPKKYYVDISLLPKL